MHALDFLPGQALTVSSLLPALRGFLLRTIYSVGSRGSLGSLC